LDLFPFHDPISFDFRCPCFLISCPVGLIDKISTVFFFFLFFFSVTTLGYRRVFLLLWYTMFFFFFFFFFLSSFSFLVSGSPSVFPLSLSFLLDGQLP